MRRLTFGLCLLLGFLLIPGSAHASALRLAPGNMSFDAVSVSACDLDGVAVTSPTTTNGAGTSTVVVVSNIAPACFGKSLPLQVWIWDPASKLEKLVQSSVVTLGATPASITVTGKAFVPRVAPALEARVMIASWPIPASWSYVPPAPLPLVSCVDISGNGNPCAATFDELFTSGDLSLFYYTVTSPTARATTEWQLTINLADPALPWLPESTWASNKIETPLGWSCNSMPVLTVNGKGSDRLVGANATVNGTLFLVRNGSGGVFTCPS